MTTATYNMTNDRLTLCPDSRLTDAEYDRAKAAKFQWWPGQKVFSAVWNTQAEDIALDLAGEITEDDTPDDVAARVDRFTRYADNAEAAATAAGNYAMDDDPAASYRNHGRVSAKRAERAFARAVASTEEAAYWQQRISSTIAHASMKDNPGVIARRIKTLEAEQRKQTKERDEHNHWLATWRNAELTQAKAEAIANYDNSGFHCFVKSEYPASTYEGEQGIWSALNKHTITPEQAQALAISDHEHSITYCRRWIEHLTMRLDYERAYLAAVGGLPVDSMPALAVGDLVKIRGNWGVITKINKVTIEVKQRYYHGKNSPSSITEHKSKAELATMSAQELSALLRM